MAGLSDRDLLLALRFAKDEPKDISSLVQNCTNLDALLYNKSALHIAAERNYMNSARILLEAKASVNLGECYGRTALHLSCRIKNCTQMVRLLLNNGAQVNAQDYAKSTPLHYAAFHQCVNTIQELLKQGATVNAVNNFGNTPLLYALKNDRTEISTVKILLKAGADVNYKHSTGVSPLHYAVGRLDIVRLLLANKCEVNVCDNVGDTPLHWAAKTELASLEVIKKLIEAGAKLNVLNFNGESAIHISILEIQSEKTREFLRGGATVKFKEYIEFLEKPSTRFRFGNRIDNISTILKDLIIYLSIQSLDSYTIIHQQLMQEEVVNLLRIWSPPQCNLENFKECCLNEVDILSKIRCDCGESSVWESIVDSQACFCDTAYACIKFLVSGQHSNFSDAIFHKLSKEFLLQTVLDQELYFEFKKSGKRITLNYYCVKIIESFLTFDDVKSALQNEQSVMDAAEFNKFIAFIEGESQNNSSSESLNNSSSESLLHHLSLFQVVKNFFCCIFCCIFKNLKTSE